MCIDVAYRTRHRDDERFFDPDLPEDEYPLRAEDMVVPRQRPWHRFEVVN